MRTKYIKQDALDCVLMAMQRKNALACRVSLATGLRISDVLHLRTEQLRADKITVRERKTGKIRRFTLGKALKAELLAIAGKVYVFEGRTDWRKPRTRQAVYKDMRRAARALRLPKGIAPHSMRKVYAVRKYNATGDIRKVQALLNHDNEAVTMLYAFADALEERGKRR